MPPEIGFPTFTSDVFLNQKPNKQTSYEEQKTLDSSRISFCTFSGERQLKTSQVDTRLCQLQLQLQQWRVNQPFKHTFSHHVSGKQYTDLGQNLFFFALFKPIILQFFTILQENLHSFNIHDDQSTRFLCTTNYSIELKNVFC